MPVGYQINGSNQPHTTNLSNHRMISKLLKPFAKDNPHFSSMLNQALLFDNFKILQGDCSSYRVPATSEAMP
ncbi:hypothetical protein D3C73_1572400 [compost metagenome]